MKRILMAAVMAVALTGIVATPSDAAAGEWPTKITNVVATGAGGLLTQVTGNVTSKNSTCWAPSWDIKLVKDGVVLETTNHDNGDFVFTVNPAQPPGEYKIVRPRTHHQGDSGKRQYCLKSRKTFTFGV